MSKKKFFSKSMADVAIKALAPTIKDTINNPDTKSKILDFINEKKKTVDLSSNEDDVILFIESNNENINLIIATVEYLISGTEIRRKIAVLKFEEIADIIMSFFDNKQ